MSLRVHLKEVPFFFLLKKNLLSFYFRNFPSFIEVWLTLCKFKMYSALVWYSNVLQYNYHGRSNTSIMSFFIVRAFKIYSFSSFQVYITVLLTNHKMFIISPELTHFITGSLCSLTSIISPTLLPMLNTILISKLRIG